MIHYSCIQDRATFDLFIVIILDDLHRIGTQPIERFFVSLFGVKYKFIIIGFFALFNFALGYLFQVSREVICFLELGILMGTGVLFWYGMTAPMEKVIHGILHSDWKPLSKIVAFGGTGLLAIVINLVIAQLMILTVIWYVMGIHTPAADTLIASMTNSLAGNLFCFATLAGLIFYEFKPTQVTPVLKSHIGFTVVSQGRSMVKVNYQDIVHIESSQNCITIYTEDKKLVKYQSLRSFLSECSCDDIKRIHGSRAVNMNYVSRIQANSNGDGCVILSDGNELKMSRTYKKGLLS